MIFSFLFYFSLFSFRKKTTAMKDDFEIGDLCVELKVELMKESNYCASLGASCKSLWSLWLEGVSFDLQDLVDSSQN
jgi:hypothetical protein